MRELEKSLQTERTAISDSDFDRLYKSSLEDFDGPQKGGACMLNTRDLVSYFERRGIAQKDMRLLYIAAPTPMGSSPIRPTESMLRDEERLRERPESGQIEWGYHAAVLVEDKVFDLSAKKTYWGSAIDQYLLRMFPDPHSEFAIRFIKAPIESVLEMADKKVMIDFFDLARQGEAVDGGMSSLWMLRNKPRSEWFWKLPSSRETQS